MTPTSQHVLDAAIAWYRDNGAVQIPEFSRVGESEVFGTCFYSDIKFAITSSTSGAQPNSIKEIPGFVMPLLAGISLGFDSHTLAKIIKDHSIPLSEITGMCFDDSLSTCLQRSDGTDGTLTPARITIEAMKAFAISMENWGTLSASIRERPFANESLGAVHTGESMLWPVSLINDHAKSIMTPSDSPVWSEHIPFSYVVSAPQSRDELPDGNPIELLRRTGMLSEPVLRKQTGLFDHWEDLAFTAGNEHDMQLEIVKSLGRVQHKPTIELITRGLRSFSVDSTEDIIDVALVFRTLKDALGENPDFSVVFNSLILKLNLIAIDRFGNGGDVEDMRGDQDLFTPLTDQQHTLLSRVAAEFLARPANQLGHSEYAAFRKLNLMKLPDQEISFSAEKLLNHLLDSLNTFVSPNKISCKHKKDLDTLAGESVTAMATLLGRHCDLDHSQFDHRSENAKIHLIRGGFDIKKFTGLSNRSKGLILEEQLGL